MCRYPHRLFAQITRLSLDIHNGHPDHIGLQTVDTNISHTRWPCVAHPPHVLCDDAVRTASRKGFRTLQPAPRLVNEHEWVGR